jgi:hypothetical protein
VRQVALLRLLGQVAARQGGRRWGGSQCCAPSSGLRLKQRLELRVAAPARAGLPGVCSAVCGRVGSAPVAQPARRLLRGAPGAPGAPPLQQIDGLVRLVEPVQQARLHLGHLRLARPLLADGVELVQRPAAGRRGSARWGRDALQLSCAAGSDKAGAASRQTPWRPPACAPARPGPSSVAAPNARSNTGALCRRQGKRLLRPTCAASGSTSTTTSGRAAPAPAPA